MHKKNLLVYLHGKGGNKSSHMPLIRKIAAKLDAEILAPDAPFPHKSGYKWFDKAEYDGRLQMKAGDFNKSVDYIVNETEAALDCRECAWDRVILCGHSQGALMAVHLGLTMCPQAVISLCGSFPDYLTYSVPIDKEVPIIWIEAGHEDHMDKQRRESYKILEAWGCNLKYSVSPNSTHDVQNDEIVDLINL